MEHTGRGDPARSLALLWRTREAPGRKGGPGLTVTSIVRAAIHIADTDGLNALSMRRVADHLGAATMSLYTHIPGKAELIDLMTDTVNAETLDPPHPPPITPWRDRLNDVAHRNWRLHQHHPWLAATATTRPVLGPNTTAKYDRELNALTGTGLTPIETDSVLTLILSHVSSSARTLAETTRTHTDTQLTDAQWWQAHAPHLEKLLDPQRYPTAAAIGAAVGAAHNTAHDPHHAFEFGLHTILDGVAALIASRT
ncbi:TetR/AcrR family transcriptional regulator [Allonocardiopsis opalescens]|uniref:TetR family transcriptional regulator n=1 Tax=Allonocardiopsis opalescens TaxID=1144618 RepID=A0A2T0Q4R2_9ACTN|nr:TetR/AcrR family transcriptional regulator [Allonocardiopsis opalescens]PRX98770.1 TetR family transcriptional regulator [Allonocardiopsis opalescens]